MLKRPAPVLAPVADEWSVALDVAWEDMSGASPWFVGESAEGGDGVTIVHLGEG